MQASALESRSLLTRTNAILSQIFQTPLSGRTAERGRKFLQTFSIYILVLNGSVPALAAKSQAQDEAGGSPAALIITDTVPQEGKVLFFGHPLDEDHIPIVEELGVKNFALKAGVPK